MAITITPRCTIIPPLARPTKPRQPCRRVAITNWRKAEPAAKPAKKNATNDVRSAATQHHRQDQRAGADPSGPEQAMAQQLARRLAPGQHRRHRHEKEQAQPERHGHLIEEGLAHADASVLERLHQQREHGAQQHHEGEGGEQQIVEQERALTTHWRVDGAGRTQSIASPADQYQRHRHHNAEEGKQERPDRRLAEGVHRLDHPERVRKVPKMVSENVAQTSDRFHTRNMPRRSCTNTECR